MIEVRPMTEEDIPAVCALEKETFSSPCSETMLRALSSHPGASFLVAFFDGIFAGYAGMVAVLDEGQICNVAVVAEFRRRGIGAALMQAQLDAAKARRLSVMMLEVRAGNMAAQALYEKEGWTRVGVRKNYYERPREDGVLYNYYL